MKTINVAELKTHLSRYLRAVRQGERFVVFDRRDPIAELVPLSASTASVWDQMAMAGRANLGTQDWSAFKPSKLRTRVPIQDILRQVREDSV